MTDIVYDLEKLLEGRQSIMANIKAYEDGLAAERDKLADYDRHIAEAKKLLAAHGVSGDGSQ